MKNWKAVLIALAYLLALPFITVWGLIWGIRYFRVLRLAVTPEISCRNCSRAVSLVGIWRCQCGFTYRGHLLKPCPVCGRVPRVVRCSRCGITMLLT